MSGRKQTIHAASTNRDTVGIAARFGSRAKPAKSLAILAIAGLLAGALPQVAAAADPDHVFAKCTFTLNSLKNALTFNDTAPPATRLRVQDLQASYIEIHVRQNPNDGQKIGTTNTFTGPILCVNSATEKNPTPTTETTDIPNATNHGAAATSADILGAEEKLTLQYQLNLGTSPGNIEKRVCYTVAGHTDCFFIQPK